MPTLCIQQDKRKQQTVDCVAYSRLGDINNTFMVICRYYGKQCNALNFVSFVICIDLYDVQLVLEKRRRVSGDRVPFA